MNALIVDTETTGIDDDAKCIEIACALYSFEYRSPIVSYSSLIYGETNDAYQINRIDPKLLRLAPSLSYVMSVVENIAVHADIVIAHGAEFDKRFCKLPNKEWVCSKYDIEWPSQNIQGESLTYLALNHGIGIVSAHRAMNDVDTLVRLFIKAGNLDMISDARRPKIRVKSLAPFAMKDIVKANGFAWNADRKVWWRNIAVEDIQSLPFEVVKWNDSPETNCVLCNGSKKLGRFKCPCQHSQ